MTFSASSPDWNTIIQALPMVITQVDDSLQVVHQFNAEHTPLATATAQPFLPAQQALLQKVLHTGEPTVFDASANPDHATWYRHQVNPSPGGLIISSLDITTHRIAAEKAAAEAHFLRRLLDTVDVGVSVFNFDTMQTTYVNGFKERMHGKKLSETPDHHYLTEIHPQDYDRAMDYGLNVIRNLGDDEISTNEYRIIAANGETRWVMVRDMVLSRGEDGHVVESIGVMVDLTERRAMEEELAQIRRWFDAIMQNATDSIAISTVGDSYDDSRFITGNHRLEELSGYTLDELRTMKASDLLADEIKPTIEERHKRGEAATTRPGIAEGTGKRKDGTTFPFESLAITTPQRELITFVRDITERKQREEELLKARLQAESALKARDIFIANMSHELRSPLNTIQGHVQLLMDHPALSADMVDHLHHIEYSTEHLSRLISDVLDLSRVEAGFDSLHPTTFDLRYLLERLGGMLDIQAKRKRLDFAIEIGGELPPMLRMDEVKLKQVLINLVDNAIKYTDKGTITLRVDALDANRLRLSIEDTGRGMSPEDREQLFAPYAREASAARFAPGSGLGLAITQRLVKLLDGDIAIESDAGSGTTVVVTLPYQDVPAPSPATVELSVYSEAGHSVLVVDDELIDRQLLVVFLTRRGFDVRMADTGAEALAMIAAEVPDLVFLDLRLPGINGLETLKRIREQYTMPVVAITADMLPENRRALLDGGCNDVIFKPYRLSTIAEVLAQHLDVTRAGTPPDPQPVAHSRPELALTEQALAVLPADWLRAMHDLCRAGDHTAAREYLSDIEDTHPETAARLRELIDQFWTTRIANAIAPLFGP